MMQCVHVASFLRGTPRRRAASEGVGEWARDLVGGGGFTAGGSWRRGEPDPDARGSALWVLEALEGLEADGRGAIGPADGQPVGLQLHLCTPVEALSDRCFIPFYW